MEKYNFSFEEIRIVEVDFKVKQPEEHGEIQVNPSLSFGHTVDLNLLEVNLGISFEHPCAPFKFNVIGVGKFKFKKNIQESFGDKINQVAIINCCSIIFPFLREIIAELTRKAGFTPMLLPPVNFLNIYKEIEQNDKNCSQTTGNSEACQ